MQELEVPSTPIVTPPIPSALIRLDLGCGDRREPGFLGVDIVAGDQVDVVCDLFVLPWPWEDESIDEVRIQHFIEHVPDLPMFMNELWRIMKVGAKCVVVAPYLKNHRAWQDPTHKQFISEWSFLYYNRQWRVENKLEQYPITCDFDFVYGYNIIDPEWNSRPDAAKQFAVKHYWDVVADIMVTLTKRPACSST
jgi:predicted SAM-dependent methyltransferase